MPLFRSCQTLLASCLLAFSGTLTAETMAAAQALEIAPPSLAQTIDLDVIDSEGVDADFTDSGNLDPSDLDPSNIDPGEAGQSGLVELDPDPQNDSSPAKDSQRQSTGQASAPLTLERPDQDPLLPGKVNGRDLTEPELQRLRLGLKRLKLEAETSYAQGDRSAAYGKFFRILGLSQYLSPQAELGNLTSIGRRMWQDSRGEEAQVITARVRQIETDAGPKVPTTQLLSLAEAYESLGDWDSAIARYEALLALKQPPGEKGITEAQASSASSSETSASSLDEVALVNRLANLSLFNLDYPSAALYTEQAIQLAPERDDDPIAVESINPDDNPDEELNSPSNPKLTSSELPLPSEAGPTLTPTGRLTQLAYIYEQDRRFAEAAAVQQQLLPRYEDPLFASQQPAIRLAIAQNQARSGQLVEAIASYQAAYGQSQTLQQFAVSSQALSQLATLYRDQEQLEDALSVYDILLQVNDLSFDLYGIVETQTARAEILSALQRVELSAQAYRQAIYAAKLLDSPVAKLQQQLDSLRTP